MNTNSKLGFILVAIAGMLATEIARSEVVYSNSTTRATPGMFTQTTGYEMGDEVNLYSDPSRWGYRFITNFIFEYYGSNFNGGEQARLRFYANDGVAYGTNLDNSVYYAPGTVLFDSGNFNISATTASTLAFGGTTLSKLKGVLVPTNFTWTVEFTGIDSGETAGLTLFNPPLVGSSTADYWEQNGGTWTSRTNNSGAPVNFGAFIEAKLDSTKPAVVFSTPINLFRAYTNAVTVTGKATDAGSSIALLMYRVGHTMYGTNSFVLVPKSNSPNWAVTNILLQPGTNYIQAKAVDGSGNESLLVTRKIQYVVTNHPVTVITLGQGTLAPNFDGANLEINRNYTMSATPGANYVFSNWLSSVSVGTTNVASSVAKYTFNMTTNLVLVADFETNRFRASSGNYYGLFTDEVTPIVSYERSGLFTLTVKTAQGKPNPFSGKLYLDGNTVGYAGLLNLDGSGVSKPVIRKGKSSLVVSIQLTFDGSDSVSGTVAALSNAPSPYVISPAAFTSAITAFKAGFNLTNAPATNLLGTYTMVADVPAGANTPKGNGYGLITMKTNGQVVSSGYMGDYAQFKPVVVQVSKDGDWPMYASTYKGILPYQDKALAWKTNKEFNGMIWGWMKFTNNTGEPTGRELLDSSVDWIKLPNTNNFYSDGFTNHDLAMHASKFVAPANPKSDRVLNITNGSITFVDGDLLSPFVNTFFMKTNSQFIINAPNVNTQTMAVVYKTGGFKGKFYHPADPVNPVRIPLGAMLQDENIIRGVFKGTNSTGSLLLQGD